ncbi:MAG: hypothetical protein JST00_25340 [Deltaproteobacteria bacterium]|nr:hypothetical protein [Deltaproteobacteria bacterium]
MRPIEAFFESIDSEWSLAHQGKVRLRIIGAGALLLEHGYDRGTKDSDVLETIEIETLMRSTWSSAR